MERRFWEGRPYTAPSACSSKFPGRPMCSWLCDSDLSSSEEKPFRCGRFFPTAEMPRGGRTGSEGGFQWVASWEVVFLDEGLEVTLRQDTACPRSPPLPPSRCLEDVQTGLWAPHLLPPPIRLSWTLVWLPGETAAGGHVMLGRKPANPARGLPITDGSGHWKRPPNRLQVVLGVSLGWEEVGGSCR